MTTALFIHFILILFGLFFLFTGVLSFSRPENFAQSLSLQLAGRSGRVEIRAQYGGFFTVAALSQGAAFLGLVPATAALMVALVIFGGLILGRMGALLVDRARERLTPMIRMLFWIDAAGTMLALAGLLTAKQS